MLSSIIWILITGIVVSASVFFAITLFGGNSFEPLMAAFAVVVAVSITWGVRVLIQRRFTRR
jgi:hypothetical protein